MSAYEGHLASLQRKTKIIAEEDIFSDSGMLVAKSGAEINQDACQSIIKFKLLKPLEDSISIADQLYSNIIFSHIVDLLNDDPELKVLHRESGCEDVLQESCWALERFPLLLQKLTVLFHELNHTYLESLLLAYLACLYGYKHKLPKKMIEQAFLGGLLQDIGFLHIDRYIFKKEDGLSSKEVRKMQSHPVIGYEILKRITNFPEGAAIAVLEHHENSDGSGYPRALMSQDLGEPGQLINLLGKVIKTYNNKLKPLGRSWRDVIPVIQVSMRSYPKNVYAGLVQVLKDVPLSSPGQVDCRGVVDLLERTRSQQDYIGMISRELKATNEKIGYIHSEKQIYAIQDIAINILVVLTSAGLDSSQSLGWQQQPENLEYQQELFSELEVFSLVQEEIISELQNYQNVLNTFVSTYPGHQFANIFLQTLEVFEKAPARENHDGQALVLT